MNKETKNSEVQINEIQNNKALNNETLNNEIQNNEALNNETLNTDTRSKDIADWMEQDAENLDIPESLLPENVHKMLDQKKRRPVYRYMLATAASLAVVAGISAIAIHNLGGNGFGPSDSSSTSTTAGRAWKSEIALDDENSSYAFDEARPTDVAGLYRQAESVEDIANSIKRHEPANNYNGAFELEGAAVEEEAASDDYASAASDTAVPAPDSSEADYSTTNLQVEGIDEGDIVKCDGKNFYIVTDNQDISICSAVNGELEEVSRIPNSALCGESLCEIYVDAKNERLYVVTQLFAMEVYYDLEEDYVGGTADVQDSSANSTTRKSHATIISFDISDHSKPTEVDRFEQDGSYSESRKVGDYLYLFTQYSLPYYTDIEYSLPCVDGEAMACADVYIPRSPATSQFVMSSVYLGKGKLEKVDTLSVLSGYCDFYMGTNAIYLMTTQYDYDETESEGVVTVDGYESYTNITKFDYVDGRFSVNSAGRVPGTVPDTFARSENGDYLYLLVECGDWNTHENRLYVLNDSLEITGQINDIAPDEYIYAARFLGDTAYFITYESVDPFFVADLSDPTDPQLLGNVEITGYSEYLHPFGKDTMLGIGYETVPNGYGGMKNDSIKLVMFDSSDPLSPAILDAKEVVGADSSDAIYNYKAILANAEKGLIGFYSESYGSDYTCVYRIFNWDGEQFVSTAKLDFASVFDLEDYYYYNVRGNYIDGYFYITCPQGIVSYDMNNDFSLVDSVSFH